ncbi:unnamed protein product [Hydatigera taeniaeformis]|uniref:Sulfate_transp domain-containing protein n=1 Tax=Hydatigena taeniaeformis TaxID=6205 RepID=A0A0R3WU60_HYDTA|nr:unnamed protein product [Hydatigera taeniaeformis]
MDEKAEGSARVRYRVKRLTYTQREFADEFHETPKSALTFAKVKSALQKVRLKTFGFELFPIFKSLASYYNLHYFVLDIIAGVTMAFFHLPQGMAYGALAGLRPVNGLYTSFFPVLAYFFFATSRHNSVGTFSLASLLFSEPINRLTLQYYNATHSTNSTAMSDEEYAFRLNLSLTLAFCVGILQVSECGLAVLLMADLQIIMALLQVGALAAYLSGPLISGFMCASAFHVVASQFNYLFGIKLPRVYGPGNLLLVRLCFRHLGVGLKFKFPIPVELILVSGDLCLIAVCHSLNAFS